MIELRYKRLVPEAKTPYKKFEPDAGFDLYATEIIEDEKYTTYKTGIAVEIPDGYVGLLFPRSSVTNYDLMLKNSVGVIDATYRGELIGRFKKHHRNGVFGEPIDCEIYNVGDRVLQLVIIEIPKIKLIEVDELSDTDRGSRGFGHSGK